ncbi:hypothetical protein V8E36_008568 [Tilletia maclaganii]
MQSVNACVDQEEDPSLAPHHRPAVPKRPHDDRQGSWPAVDGGSGEPAERGQPQQAAKGGPAMSGKKGSNHKEAAAHPPNRNNPKTAMMKPIPIADTSHSLNALAQNAAYFDVQRAILSSFPLLGVGGGGVGSSSSPSTVVCSSSSSGSEPRKKKKVKMGSGGNGGVKELTALAHKSVTALDPSMKHAFCSGCGTTLIPGLTASIRIRPSGPHRRMLKIYIAAATW